MKRYCNASYTYGSKMEFGAGIYYTDLNLEKAMSMGKRTHQAELFAITTRVVIKKREALISKSCNMFHGHFIVLI